VSAQVDHYLRFLQEVHDKHSLVTLQLGHGSKGQIFETPLTMTHLPVRKKRNGLMKSARQTPLLPFPANVNKGPQTAGGGNPTIAPPEIKKKHVSLLRTSYNYFTSTPRKYELVAALRENRR